jgi:isopentenyl phosphate kinase
MLELAEAVPGLSIQIFSGESPENLKKTLLGEILGTIIEA